MKFIVRLIMQFTQRDSEMKKCFYFVLRQIPHCVLKKNKLANSSELNFWKHMPLELASVSWHIVYLFDDKLMEL